VITTLMTSRVVAVSPGTALIEALRVMDSAGVRHLPVVEETRCVAWGIDAVIVLENDHVHGIVTASDLAASLVEQGSAVSTSAAAQQPAAAEDPPEIGT
jgi:CBS domain-containing protein